jgi:hypothetical protein
MTSPVHTPSAVRAIIVADDPIEAGMLALDLVQAGLQAQAVRDGAAALQQVRQALDGAGQPLPAVVTAFRQVGESVRLWGQLVELGPRPGFVAVVFPEQLAAVDALASEEGWTGVAVRPVRPDTLVALVRAAARLPAAHPAQVREGDLRDVLLLDLLATVVERVPTAHGGRDAEITLESLGRTGVVAVVDGELVHAECDGDTGRHALERLCCWRQGVWRLDPVLYRGPRTLAGASVGLLAVAQDYARRVEQARQALPYVDRSCTVRWERARPLPVVAEAMFRRIAAGDALGEAVAGDGDDELEAYAALETRIRRGAVLPVGAQLTASGGVAPVEVAPHRLGGDTAPQGLRQLTEAALDAAEVVPERRHKHLTTDTYGVDGVAASADFDEADFEDAAFDDGDGGESIEAPEVDAPPLEAAETTAPPSAASARPSAAGSSRRGMVTGWFGGEPASSPSSSSGLVDAASTAAEPPVRRTGWWLAGVLTIVLGGLVAWGVVQRRAATRPTSPYAAAIELSDAGRDQEAIAALDAVVREGGAEPEALLNLAVLEADAGRRDDARKHLAAYLQAPGARHLERARRFQQRVLGP